MARLINFSGRFLLLNAGLFIFSCAIYSSMQSGLGMSAWDVFHQGISRHTPLTFGQVSQVVGLVLLGVGWAAGQKPGLGTICNMFFIGLWLDFLLGSQILPQMNQYGLVVQLLVLLISLPLFGLGSGMYLKAAMGAGPRDSLMLVLVKLSGWRVAIIRGSIEFTVFIIGLLLGGTGGLGTIIIALGIGPAVEMGFKLLRVKVKKHEEAPRPVLSATPQA